MQAIELIKPNLEKIVWDYQIMLGETNYFVGLLPDGRKFHFGADRKEKVMKIFIDRKGKLPAMYQDLTMIESYDILESAVMGVDVAKSYLVNRILNIIDIFDIRGIGSQKYGCPDEYVNEAVWLMDECIGSGVPHNIDSSVVKKCWCHFFGDVDDELEKKSAEFELTVELINSALVIYWTAKSPKEGNQNIFEYLIENRDRIEVVERKSYEDYDAYICKIPGDLSFEMSTYSYEYEVTIGEESVFITNHQVCVDITESNNYFHPVKSGIQSGVKYDYENLYEFVVKKYEALP